MLTILVYLNEWKDVIVVFEEYTHYKDKEIDESLKYDLGIEDLKE